MHIVAIGWLYVTLMMAITEKSVTAGVLTFVFYGLAPCALLLWLVGTQATYRARKRQSLAAQSAAEEKMNQPDGADAGPDK